MFYSLGVFNVHHGLRSQYAFNVLSQNQYACIPYWSTLKKYVRSWDPVNLMTVVKPLAHLANLGSVGNLGSLGKAGNRLKSPEISGNHERSWEPCIPRNFWEILKTPNAWKIIFPFILVFWAHLFLSL